MCDSLQILRQIPTEWVLQNTYFATPHNLPPYCFFAASQEKYSLLPVSTVNIFVISTACQYNFVFRVPFKGPKEAAPCNCTAAVSADGNGFIRNSRLSAQIADETAKIFAVVCVVSKTKILIAAKHPLF